jgi:putative two-component system response regulator
MAERPRIKDGAGKRRVLVADREPMTGLLLTGFLEEEYELAYASDGDELMTLVGGKARPEIILLDASICDSGSYRALERLKSDPASSGIPVIFLASILDESSVQRALELGAADFIQKPCMPGIVKLRIEGQLELSRSRSELELAIEERTRELKDSRLEIIRRLCRAAEYRDNETGMHIVRMSKYSQIIAQAAGASVAKSELVQNAAPMHDIGKIGIPDSVLLKRGALDEPEWKVMRQHCKIGADIIGKGDSELLRYASAAALTHHERYDGQGYPAGLSGEAIPWIGRVIAIADVFDALTSERPYKRAWPMEQAFDLIRSESGSHFDPELVAAFLEAEAEVSEVMALYPDYGSAERA